MLLSLIAIVLAAGQGKRMRSDLPKVLHPAAGRSLLHWALQAAEGIEPDRTLVIIGHEAEQVARTLPPGTEASRPGTAIGNRACRDRCPGVA